MYTVEIDTEPEILKLAREEAEGQAYCAIAHMLERYQARFGADAEMRIPTTVPIYVHLDSNKYGKLVKVTEIEEEGIQYIDRYERIYYSDWAGMKNGARIGLVTDLLYYEGEIFEQG